MGQRCNSPQKVILLHHAMHQPRETAAKNRAWLRSDRSKTMLVRLHVFNQMVARHPTPRFYYHAGVERISHYQVSSSESLLLVGLTTHLSAPTSLGNKHSSPQLRILVHSDFTIPESLNGCCKSRYDIFQRSWTISKPFPLKWKTSRHNVSIRTRTG